MRELVGIEVIVVELPPFAEVSPPGLGGDVLTGVLDDELIDEIDPDLEPDVLHKGEPDSRLSRARWTLEVDPDGVALCRGSGGGEPPAPQAKDRAPSPHLNGAPVP